MEIKSLVENFIAILILQGNVVKALALTWLLYLARFTSHVVLVWVRFGEVGGIACLWV